jgi:protein suppressor of PHYA-105 1
VDDAFFRVRSAVAAGGGEAPSPKGQQESASRSLQAALQPWRDGSASPTDSTARLPPHLDGFSRDLDRFSRYGDFRVVAHLKYGDGLAAPDMVCSTAFDRDDEFFATAGVSRRVKVYEYASLLEGDAPPGGAHYPVLDLPFRAKLSCVAWNTYLKSHLLAADYAGIATLVDANAGTEVAAFAEHAKRVWSVDFSATDPQRFLSGSDDGTVRLWSINEPNAVAAIDAKANVCSVQFSPTDANLMAFGAANYRTYLYDLRRIQSPLAVIAGHSRAVSYVRFLGCGRRLLTASTDSALKLWDIAAEVARPAAQPSVPDLTYTGHVNEKNFVGLSVTPAGYIATGSEDNSVVAYHASMPVPVARHCFGEPSGGHGPFGPAAPGGTPPGGRGAAAAAGHSGGSGGAEAQQFVSSVAWTRAGSAAVASNSQGHLRVLELV